MTNGPNGHAGDRAYADAARTQIHIERREVWKLHQERVPRRCRPRPDRAGRRTSRGVPRRWRAFRMTRLNSKPDPLSQTPAPEGRPDLGKRDSGAKTYPVNVIFPISYGH